MKITCQVCQAKYSIADERVAGKTVKIKCKKCGTAIVVHGNGNESAAMTAPAEPASLTGMPVAAEGEEEGETRVFGGEHGAAPAAVAAAAAATPGDEWTVNVNDNDQRTMTTAQIVSEYQRGAIPGDAYVWKDGMADWLPLANVPELMQLVSSGSPPAAAPAAQASPQYGQDGTVVMHNAAEGAPAAAAAAAPATAATPTAARRATNRGGGVDVFTAAEGRQGGAVQAAPPPVPQGDRRVGERNETSVLFSLSALTAAEGASRGGKSASDDALIDMRPSPSAPRNNGRDNARSGLDDIMNLGGGISASPMLAPPPMLAPVIEPPPMAPAVAPMAPMASGGMAGSAYAMPEPMPQKKSKTGLIVGVLGFLVVLGGVGAYFATREAPPAPTPTTAETAAANAPSSAPSTAPAETAAAAPTETAAPTAAPSSGPTSAPAAAAPVGGRPVSRPSDKPSDKEKPEEKPAEKPPEEKPAPKAEEKPAPAAASGKEFDRASALSALGAAASSARSCKKPDGPTGSGKVKVTFAPSGNVTSATVDGPPFAGTAVGGCVASAFRGAHVPPFDGAPVSVSKTFNIN